MADESLPNISDIGIPPMLPYEFTCLTSAVEASQPDPTKRFVGIYYQDPDRSIQRLLRSINLDPTDKFAALLPTVVLKLPTPLAAITPPEVSIGPRFVQIYAVSEESSIIDVSTNDVVVLQSLEDTKLAAITDYTVNRVFYQPKGKENEIAQAVPGSQEVKTIVQNATKGTNIAALETSIEKIGFLNFDRCLVYHGQDSNLHFWWTEGESPPHTEVIPAGSVLLCSAVTIVRKGTRIFVFYQHENSELHYIVKSENLGFRWGEPQKVENVTHQPRSGTALTAIIPPGEPEISLSYQDTRGQIQTVYIKA